MTFRGQPIGEEETVEVDIEEDCLTPLFSISQTVPGLVFPCIYSTILQQKVY